MEKYIEVFSDFLKRIILLIVGRKNYERLAFISSIKHKWGAKKIRYGKNEAIVVCIVRNGESYSRSFIDHYFSLGVKHIVFLNNDSEDGTAEIARSYQNVTIFNFKSPLRGYEIFLENYFIKKFCKNRWCINVDIDELLDYPFSDVISLKELLEYFNANSYTAVIGQMLDMFSEKPLNEMTVVKDSSLSMGFRYYDVANIRKYDYATCTKGGLNNKKNLLSNQDIKFYFGGIRDYVFNSDNGLTKHPIIFVHKKLNIIHAHCVENAHCADISSVLFHYPFVGFLKKIHQYIKENYGAVAEYKAYLAKYEKSPNMMIKQDTSQKLYCINDLVENEFLVVSNSYLKFVNQHKKTD